MRRRDLFLAMSVLLASTLTGAGELNWNYKPTDLTVRLVMADDSQVAVEATPTRPAKAIRGNSSWTLTFEVRGDASDRQVKGSPIFIDLGRMDPIKPAHPFNLVKLDKKGGLRSWVMKATDTDFFPLPGNEIIPLERRPRPVQATDGNVTLTLPMALPPGEYALFLDVEAWEFTVRAN